MNNTLYLVIPCYNEEEVLTKTGDLLIEKLETLIKREMVSQNSKILFVNDGSKDNTWQIIQELHNKNKLITGISLAKNSGHQNALIAGLKVAAQNADMIVSMDADLQDDINAIDEMIDKYNKGNQIVYGVRSSRKKDSIFKRVTAQFFYKLMKILGAEVIYNHADYRLMSKRAVEELLNYKEVNMFLRGIVPLIGFKNDVVYYERNKRVAGKTKYPLTKMIKFALNAITSFSVKPLRMIAVLGFLIFLFSVGMMIYVIYTKFYNHAELGWASTLCSIWMIGGIQLLCMGVVGEYIGKIYEEVKARPKYIIEEKIGIK